MEVTRSPDLGNKAPRPEQQQQGSRGAAQTPPSTNRAPLMWGGCREVLGGLIPAGCAHRRLGGAAAAQSLGSTTGGGLRSDPQAASRKIPRTSAGLSAGLPLLHSPAGSLSGGQEQAAATAQPRHRGGTPTSHWPER